MTGAYGIRFPYCPAFFLHPPLKAQPERPLNYGPLTLSLGLQYESKRRTESWIGAQSAWMGDITLLNAQIEYKTPQFSVYLRGANLLDFDYARAYGYPEPGFQATLGAKIALNTP